MKMNDESEERVVWIHHSSFIRHHSGSAAMAEAITIVCPECEKKINVPSEAVGKKVRCKGCEHVFVVAAPGGKKASKRPARRPDQGAAGGQEDGAGRQGRQARSRGRRGRRRQPLRRYGAGPGPALSRLRQRDGERGGHHLPALRLQHPDAHPRRVSAVEDSHRHGVVLVAAAWHPLRGVHLVS